MYHLLVDAGLQKIFIHSQKTNALSFVFGSKTNFTNTKKLLLLINGSGAVRAGQWAQSLIINESIEHGSMIAYIKRARQLAYDVLVLNTNENTRMENGKLVHLHDYEESHINTVWAHLRVHQVDAFCIVAHSAGGHHVMKMVENFPKVFLTKCFGIAFTDSTLNELKKFPNELREWCIKVI